MSNTRILMMSHAPCRFISLSSTSYKNYASRESKFLCKMLNKNEPKRKWYKDNPKSFIDNGINIQKKKLTSFHVQRRLTVLNKLFMKYITDLMSTGETAPKMLDHQIEVTSVTLSPDFKVANVFWTHEKVNNKHWLTTTEELLTKYAFTLRHELSQLRVISHVPPIQFVKDKTYSLAKEVEDRLAIIDLDKGSNNPTLTSKETVRTCPSSEIGEDGSDTEIVKTDDINSALPQMRHDVLGLDHHRIMSKLKSCQNESAHKSKNNTTYPTCTSGSTNTLTDKKQQELFIQFLKMREIRGKQKYCLTKSTEMKHNPIYTDLKEFDDDEDLETSFDDTADYNENIYDNEIDNYDWNIEEKEFQ